MNEQRAETGTCKCGHRRHKHTDGVGICLARSFTEDAYCECHEYVDETARDDKEASCSADRSTP